MPEDFSRFISNKLFIKAEKKSSSEIQKTSFELDAQRKILKIDSEMWQKIFQDAMSRNLISFDEKSDIKTALKIPQKIPSPLQYEKLLRLLKRLEENGLTHA